MGSYFGDHPDHREVECDEHGKMLVPLYVNGRANADYGCPACKAEKRLEETRGGETTAEA